MKKSNLYKVCLMGGLFFLIIPTVVLAKIVPPEDPGPPLGCAESYNINTGYYESGYIWDTYSINAECLIVSPKWKYWDMPYWELSFNVEFTNFVQVYGEHDTLKIKILNWDFGKCINVRVYYEFYFLYDSFKIQEGLNTLSLSWLSAFPIKSVVIYWTGGFFDYPPAVDLYIDFLKFY
ncbi:MAG: hypothetical protein ACFE9Z_16665 [Promethearchaeota archaeon]